jgi:transcriptional regulator with XRE-family HTH domain
MLRGMGFREFRKLRGYDTQEDLAAVSKVLRATISQLDCGKVRDPRYSTLKALSLPLRTTVDELAAIIARGPKELA